ncbi:Fe-S cluster assembly protein SufB [archaeon]|nr:MAG: Fe-S cluster assembly protein SufB [archaeon]
MGGSMNDYAKKFGFKFAERPVHQSEPGISKKIVNEISEIKGEQKWISDSRLKALEHFTKRPMPTWGPDLSEIDFDNTIFYNKPTDKAVQNWDELPTDIRKTFDKLGIPEAERKFLAGVGAQYNSEMVYHKIKEDLAKQGVIFVDPDTAFKKYPDIFKKWFGTVVPHTDNKFAALNSAFFSGGSFIYIPPNVEVKMPLQAYFRMNAENMAQFERTLIIADKGSKVHFMEGCTAPIYSKDSLHAGVVEIIALPGSHVRYTTMQNWSNNVYNLVTKRAYAFEDAIVEWIDANIGSKISMKYPCVVMKGKGARADILSVALAGNGQNLDTGGKAIHLAPNTTSRIVSKSVSHDGGKTNFRGLVKVKKGATDVKSHTKCDALILDNKSFSGTIPQLDVNEDSVSVGHEATVGRIGEDQLFYLTSRGLNEDEATAMIVNGFFETFVKELPTEYAVEFNRLIQLQVGRI